MTKRKLNSRALRQLAADLLEDASGKFDLSLEDREGLITSLVRQWITYDGHALLFLEETKVYFHLGSSPLGRSTIGIEPCPSNWPDVLRDDWQIGDDDLRDLLRQLNVGQSAEVVNQEGTTLRVWVDPKQRTNQVEPLSPEPRRPDAKRDFLKIALYVVRDQFSEVDEQQLDELAHSVAKQWQQYHGQACIFLDEQRQGIFRLIERPDGGCGTNYNVVPIQLKPLLTSLGCPEEMVGDVMIRFNLGHEVEVRDAGGEPCILWHDPEKRTVRVRPLNPRPEVPQAKLASIFCPHCTAVLKLWSEEECEQACPNCGRAVPRATRPARDVV